MAQGRRVAGITVARGSRIEGGTGEGSLGHRETVKGFVPTGGGIDPPFPQTVTDFHRERFKRNPNHSAAIGRKPL